MPQKSFGTLYNHLHDAMTESLPIMVDKHVKEQVEQQVPGQVHNQVLVYVAEGLILERQKTKEEMEKMIAKSIPQERGNIHAQISSQIQQAIDDPHDDAHPEGEKSAKRQKTSEYKTYVSGKLLSGHDNEQEQGLSISGNQEKADDYDFCSDSYTSDDDEIPTKQLSQDIMEKVSLNANEAKLKKITVEMLRQRCTLGDKHQYHIDQMKNFLKSDIVWESRKEILVSPHPRKTTPLVLSCQRDLEAPTLSLINQYLLYLKKGNSGPKKIVLSLYRANDCIVSITEPDFKNLNKNDIEDMYLLIMNEKVPDYAETSESYQHKVNLTAPTISFPGIEEFEMFSINYEHVHRIIYKNNKKEKRVMRRSKILKFCDATLNRVLKGLKSYNNDVRYGYNQRDLTKYEVEYLKLYKEEIEDRLKYRRQMRKWESYVNGRPLGLIRERPE
nr:hypothetical protein [Tanacetum cinerariifolium]